MTDDRFEIREKPPGEVARSLGATEPVFQVWDTAADRAVMFGNYSRRDRAQARIDRTDPAHYCTSCGFHVGGGMHAARCGGGDRA